MTPIQTELTRRPRRLRKSPAVRALVQETSLHTDDLIWPVFVHGGKEPFIPVDSMPDVHRFSLEQLEVEAGEAQELGIKALALFPCTPAHLKDDEGSESLNPENLICQAIRAVKQAAPEILVITDVALDPYTSHGHDGLLTPDGSDVDNDPTVARLCEMAILQAQAGADWVAPSDMMDGRIGAIREELDAEGLTQTAILAYSAKYASAFYGPFRDAVGSSAAASGNYLDKKTYQLSPSNAREALTEAELDEEEGADVLMVKPAGPYLDIIRMIRDNTNLPLAAYQVSGEYAQIHAAAANGWLDLKACRDESLLAIKRAGADMILTYFAKSLALELNS